MAVHVITKGLDLPITGGPEQRVYEAPAASKVAVLARDYPFMKPRMRIQEGDRVQRGQVLFEDRRTEGVRFTAPAAGTVSAIHRGARRALRSVVIDLTESEREGKPAADDHFVFTSYTGRDVKDLDRAAVRDLLVESGLWTAIRRRPFSNVPSPSESCRSIFVTAIDTDPFGVNPEVALEGRMEDFKRGLWALSHLTDGPVFLCRAPGSRIEASDAPRVRVEEFKGKHPAGLVGTHIHFLERVDQQRTVWHIGYQDVIAIGAWSAQGRLSNTRVVTVAGPALREGRLVETLAGADLGALIGSERIDGNTASRHGLDSATEATAARIISGPALSGRLTDRRGGYLGRYHQQVVMLPALSPAHAPARAAAGAGMLAVEAFDAVWPFAMPVAPLLRALLIEDTEAATALGATLLAPEDLALCEYVCPSRLDYGAALARTLDRIRRGG